MSNDTAFLEIRRLSKVFVKDKSVFRKNSGNVAALTDVGFVVREGEILGVVGESGCGKSTLGRCMLRLIEPTGSEVLYRGRNLMELSREEMRLMRTKLQMIFQNPYASLNPRMTVRELIRSPLDVFSVGAEQEREAKVFEMIEHVGMNENQLRRYPHEFSGGQLQRIVIARALILNPEFIVCDEAVSAPDVSVRSQVLNLMKYLQLRFGLTYLFISHDLSVVRHLCDYVMVGGAYARKIPKAVTYGMSVSNRWKPEDPGRGDGHQPDEYVDVNMLLDGLRIYIKALAAISNL
ncbi:MAG: ATP-binding cassette domain-containing protein [Clostridiales Family XIII bacterium]|jgi:peptide/nickel transport system ATP-binding protein/oligopeptide transport system ATP-binding protein|nr:ATP-binding cassette domain-containing protein [Clostridiales Family XIII bacterium]